MTCSACGSRAAGAFCAACGAPQDGAKCRACGKGLTGGARFCTSCGEAVRARSSHLPWYIAGGSIAALILVLLLPTLRPAPPGLDSRATGTATAQSLGAEGMQAPPLTGSIREQADRLFNRIMEARSQGDTARAEFFMPMALMAYREVPDLDDDGYYHLAVLEAAAGEHASALATAERLLAQSPAHLLALGIASEAALELGDASQAGRFARRLLDAWDGERDRQLPEYLDHARVLPVYREAAERIAGN
jgi:tetratricopeptide (TPR) repeat protein